MTNPASAERPEGAPVPDPGTSSSSRTARPSRRGLVGALGASLLAGRTAGAQGAAQVAPAAPKKARPRFDRTLVALVNRVTQGFTVEEYTLARELGYEGYLEHHLDHLAIDDSAIQPFLGGLPTLTQTPNELQDAAFADPTTTPVSKELKAAALYRATRSPRQLFERMVEFWTDHFNIDIHDKSCRFMKHVDDVEVVRAHALGTFPAMLDASAHSAAMMFYLDNYANLAGAAQENYAREIMELHTLGVNGGYTEQDVKEVARCFTGWGMYSPQAANFGNFLYIPANHDTGEKTVLGNTIPAGGQMEDALQVMQILVDHPSTASFVGGKLTRWLLVHEPDQEVLDDVAATYTATGGDVKAMIRTALRKKHLNAAKPWLQANRKLKRPFHFMASLLRAVDAEITNLDVVVSYEMGVLGMEPFAFPPPTGYPDSPGAWGSSLRPRWSFANRMMANAIPGLAVDVPALGAKLDALGQGSMAERIDALLTGGSMTQAERAALDDYFASFGSINDNVLAEGIALAASSPSFQLY